MVIFPQAVVAMFGYMTELDKVDEGMEQEVEAEGNEDSLLLLVFVSN